MKIFEYLYFRLYYWNLNTWGKNDAPQWNALLGVSFMMYLNILDISLIIQFSGLNILFRTPVPRKEIIILMLALGFINYMQFVRNQKYLIIAKKYSHEIPKQRKRKSIWLWAYVIISFLVLIGLSILHGKIGNNNI